MQMGLPVIIISMLLFLVLFFGIGFLLNMLLRMTWIMAFIYPIITILIVDEVRFIEYFRDSQEAFSSLGVKLASLTVADILILASGLAGAILSGVTMKTLRKKGYRMF
ncbi:purine-cytosine permease-like protein [Bacillus pakistanensis]|uniref:Purine-cytosine permease-like protein n=1 Tax=Rossellomorea pakistanensis TaxID=992288 RepID=A0ABS2NEE6_9BACI|nr:YuiB family protein [Bacillus pakistanensis]MBM7586231.1 purine-cytosine permease-like protein [Bacillus pakistanensis]